MSGTALHTLRHTLEKDVRELEAEILEARLGYRNENICAARATLTRKKLQLKHLLAMQPQ